MIFPDAIQQAVRVVPDNDLVRYQDISFNEKKVYLADSNFFQIFDFPLLKGDAATALRNRAASCSRSPPRKNISGKKTPWAKYSNSTTGFS
jgi:putative ABC transport system permease protein